MTAASDVAERALRATTRAEVLACLPPPGRSSLTLPEIQGLARHLERLDEPRVPLRLGILGTYTSDPLDPYLRFEALLQGLQLGIYHGPYGAIVQEAGAGSGLVEHAPDLTVLLLRWEDLDPRLAGSWHALTGAERASLATAVRAHLRGQLGAVRRAVGGHLLVTVLPAMHEPRLGDYEVNAPGSEPAWRSRLKVDLAADLQADLASTTLIDLDESLSSIGRDRFFDRRWWYSTRFPFSSVASQEVARRIVTVGTLLKRPRAKVIALDADDTLWGGVVGEDGPDGIALGPDYPGNVYVAFQRRLLDYQQRGLVLTLCSKNNEADVFEVLRQHPHQVLREEHFAAMRVNWDPKPQNLQRLADELGLGLDSFVFVDDSAHECLGVRQSLPEVEVVQVPARLIDVPGCLDRLPRLEILALTREDRTRTELYAQERRRRDLASASADVSSYLRSLQMEMSIGVDDRRHAARIAQLTQKTNQFNLTTRRYSEDEIDRLMQVPDGLVAHFSVRDVFGDSGIVGVAIVRGRAPAATLDSFLMSCRVIGRRAESAFLEAVLGVLRRGGVRTLEAEYRPTAKNRLAATFLADHGFVPRADGRQERDLDGPVPAVAADLAIVVRLADARLDGTS